jgi:DNA-binding NtrC family response regulator
VYSAPKAWSGRARAKDQHSIPCRVVHHQPELTRARRRAAGLELPPLRDRPEDIAPLADHFLKIACAKLHLPEPTLTAQEAARLEQYSWPGNIRELQNVLERAVILARGGTLHFQLDQPVAAPGFVTESRWRELERENILKALEAAGGRVSGPGGAAELLGMNPNTLASRLRAFGITKTYASHA